MNICKINKGNLLFLVSKHHICPFQCGFGLCPVVVRRKELSANQGLFHWSPSQITADFKSAFIHSKNTCLRNHFNSYCHLLSQDAIKPLKRLNLRINSKNKREGEQSVINQRKHHGSKLSRSSNLPFITQPPQG